MSAEMLMQRRTRNTKFILLFLGGIVGGALGGGALAVNYQIFQNKLPLHIKYLITGAMTVVAWVLYLVIATAIMAFFRG